MSITEEFKRHIAEGVDYELPDGDHYALFVDGAYIPHTEGKNRSRPTRVSERTFSKYIKDEEECQALVSKLKSENSVKCKGSKFEIRKIKLSDYKKDSDGEISL